jgi:hypothetical protein
MLHHILAETERVSKKVLRDMTRSNRSKASRSRSWLIGGGGGYSPTSSDTSARVSIRSTFMTATLPTITNTNKNTNESVNSTKSNVNPNKDKDTTKDNKDINIQVLKQGHVDGFTWAQTRFGTGADPPTWNELKDSNNDIQQVRRGGSSSISNTNKTSSLFQRFFCGPSLRTIRGGTTATTLSLVGTSIMCTRHCSWLYIYCLVLLSTYEI